MKKLLAGTAIAFLMILTASLASARNTVQITTLTGTGTLWFAAVNGTGIIEVDDAVITLTQVTPSAGQPGDLWTGTLTLPTPNPLDEANAVTINISAFKGPDDPHLFDRIAGTATTSTGAVILSAGGHDNDRAWDTSVTPSKSKLGFGIRGQVYEGSTFAGSFEGVLFY